MATQKLSKDIEREIIALYLESNTPVSEIQSTYKLTNGLLYSLLNRHKVERRNKYRRPTPTENLDWGIPEPLPELRTTHAADVTVTADANGFVQAIERKSQPQKLYIWEVRFESAMRLEAASITEAIREVEKLPMCRRVYGVSLKLTP